MTDEQIENIIRDAERQAGNASFIGARLMGIFSLLLTPFVFISELSSLVVCLVGICALIGVTFWVEGRKLHRDLMKSRAKTLWEKIDYIGIANENPSPKERELLQHIGLVYAHDPQGKILPLPQAIRLVLAWKQQQTRLQSLNSRLKQLRIDRNNLLEKQKLLRELGDQNPSLERALAQLNDDMAPLQRRHDTLRASCLRLESLLAQVTATVRRRELHREVGEITARLSSSQTPDADPFDLPDEHLDIERQIEREIETYLQLERETESHLRDL